MAERVINGRTFLVQSLPARRQFAYLARLRGLETALDVPEDVVNGLLDTATVDGKPLLPVIDEILRDRMDDFIAVVELALEVNYRDFFVAKAAAPNPTPTPARSAT